jgi:hypothetical protein
MDGWGVYVTVLGLGLILSGVITTFTTRPGRVDARFRRLDVFTGRSEGEIVPRVGQPHEVRPTPDGGKVLTWTRQGCEIALRFDAGGVCREMSLGAEGATPAHRPARLGSSRRRPHLGGAVAGA